MIFTARSIQASFEQREAEDLPERGVEGVPAADEAPDPGFEFADIFDGKICVGKGGANQVEVGVDETESGVLNPIFIYLQLFCLWADS